MYLRYLQLDNVRCFKSARLVFQYPGRKPRELEPPVATLPNVTLLLGNNGSGKTTVLQGAALALISPVLQHTGFRPQSIVRRTFGGKRGAPPKYAVIKAGVKLVADDLLISSVRNGKKSKRSTGKPGLAHIELAFARLRDTETIKDAPSPTERWRGLFEEKTKGFLVLGYGANRWIAPRHLNVLAQFKENHIRYQRIRGLFEDGTALVPLSHWLPNFSNRKQLRQVIHILNELLSPHGYTFEGEHENGELLFKHGGANIPYPALSHGFRAFIGWIGDLLYHICEWCPSALRLREIQGVVLVDEIDLYLHPEWQRMIIASLSQTFKKLQFIFSSHSPLVTGSLEWPNIWVMPEDSSKDGPHQLPEEPINGLSADQVLMSPYFGVKNTRSDEKMDMLASLESRARKGDGQAANDFMRELTVGMEARKYGISVPSEVSKPLSTASQTSDWAINLQAPPLKQKKRQVKRLAK